MRLCIAEPPCESHSVELIFAQRFEEVLALWEDIQKKSVFLLDIVPPLILDTRLNPPSPFGQCPKERRFFLDIFPMSGNWTKPRPSFFLAGSLKNGMQNYIFCVRLPYSFSK